MRKREKALKFLEHIEDHLRGSGWELYPPKVMCKICNKTIDEIIEEG